MSVHLKYICALLVFCCFSLIFVRSFSASPSLWQHMALAKLSTLRCLYTPIASQHLLEAVQLLKGSSFSVCLRGCLSPSACRKSIQERLYRQALSLPAGPLQYLRTRALPPPPQQQHKQRQQQKQQWETILGVWEMDNAVMEAQISQYLPTITGLFTCSIRCTCESGCNIRMHRHTEFKRLYISRYRNIKKRIAHSDR